MTHNVEIGPELFAEETDMAIRESAAPEDNNKYRILVLWAVPPHLQEGVEDLLSFAGLLCRGEVLAFEHDRWPRSIGNHKVEAKVLAMIRIDPHIALIAYAPMSKPLFDQVLEKATKMVRRGFPHGVSSRLRLSSRSNESALQRRPPRRPCRRGAPPPAAPLAVVRCKRVLESADARG